MLRTFNKNQKVPSQKLPIPDFPFQRVSFDAIGPFKISAYGNKYLIVITDTFIKYPEVYPVPDIQSSTVCKVLIDFISRHGIMQILYSDKGSNFISQAMQEVYKTLGIKKLQTVSFNPQANGVVERLNKTLIDSLSHLVSKNQMDWCQLVPLALMAYRNAYQRTIKESPAFLVYGRNPVMPLNLIYSDPLKSYSDTPTYAKQLVMKLQNSFAIVRKNLESSAQTYTKTNEKWPKSKRIEVGDMVYLHVPRIKENTTKKLAKFNQGPYRVIGKVYPVVFEIQRIDKPTD
ncbi:Pol polyprotein [Araneus ventricosus]|uniref:Pol polyprotein n=1 Tax=Araneus ventricosus TaxID=182803 RepID=A0A4Y2Q5Y9_ARAVE|nr:Pol polyprotein [Araneus ventricosus]